MGILCERRFPIEGEHHTSYLEDVTCSLLALDGCHRLLGIADKDREPLSIVNPGLRGIIFVEAVVQILDVCRRRMCFDGQRTDIHR